MSDVITRAQILEWLQQCASTFLEHQEALGQLDQAIGDGDHGQNMRRGFAKVAEKCPDLAEKSIADIFKTTGMTLLSSVGGASGPLYGTFFIKAAQQTGDADSITLEQLAAAIKAGTDGIIARGHAEAGDKTMCDVWLPVCSAFDEAVAQNTPVSAALADIAQRAGQAAEATTPMQAKKGRASYLNERSIGHKDPGATSSALMLATLSGVVDG